MKPASEATATDKPVVLVVDDAPSTLGMLRDALEAEGYTVLVAADGEAALECLSWATPDAILLDAMLPGLSGFDTCRRIKANAGLAQIPVVFMTGLTETTHVLEGFAAGGVDYVTKPLRTREVLARLHTHWRNARQARLAREAVDVAGRGVVMLSERLGERQDEARGEAQAAGRRIAWCSPQAQRWLQALGLPPQASCWPAAWAVAPAGEQALPLPAGGHVLMRHVGEVGLGETMLMLELREGTPAARPRVAAAALTAREAEVLSWLAKGKTNRDIAEILGISRHTVSKHLEHLFEKLGVETRSAATALAALHGQA
ncbi:DNA-binding response regulator [Aquincola sp. MAHUQ-54]|uniref:DNA-binding response regulator n=1 Tax=Aquincola agrisoli TaxID=3119538 RepID=A0AAW9QC70_9BURK